MLPYINKPFEVAAAALGASTDEFKLLFSFLLSYPLASVLKRISDNRADYKNVYVITVGLFYLVGLFSLWSGLRTISIAAGGAYALAYFLPASPYMPWLGFAFLMGHMAVNHLHRQLVDDSGAVDITGAQMVLVMKLSAFCWNVFDGTLPDDLLSDFQRDRRIIELPSLLDYVGYVLFFPSLLAGPSFDYNEYKGWVDCTMFNAPASVDPSKKPARRKSRHVPPNMMPALLKAGVGVLFILAFLACGSHFPWNRMVSDEYLTYSILHRVLYLYLALLVQRFKYYGVWSLAEGSCILSGLGYNGVDPVTRRVKWDRLQNIDPVRVELAQNNRGYVVYWNMNTTKWLRYYVFTRVTPRKQKPGFGATMATFATSAFWHGFYPGYYLSFTLAALGQSAAKDVRRHVRPFFLDPVKQQPLPSKRYYDIVSWVVTQLNLAFCMAPFVVLGFQDSVTVWKRHHFFGVVCVLGCLAFFASPCKATLRARLEQRTKEANAGAARSVDSDGLRTPGGRSPELPVLGVPADIQEDVSGLVDQVRAEVGSVHFRKTRPDVQAMT